MTTLRESAKEVAVLGAKMIEVRSIDTRATELKKAGDELREQLRNLRPLVESLAAFSTTDALKDAVKAQGAPSSLTKDIADSRTSAAKAAERMIEEKAIDVTKLRSKLSTWRNDLQVALNTAWQNYVTKQFEPMNRDLLAALERCGFRKEIQAIRDCNNDVSAAIELPQNSQDIHTFDAAIKAYQERLNELDAPEAVRQFLVDAVSRGASLDSLTEEVRNWLDARNLNNSFQVRVSQSTGRM